MNIKNQCRSFAAVIAALLFTVLLVGCANNAAPGKLARDWSCKIREMQVRPLFPPREDLQVGDVYWLETAGESDAQNYCAHGILKPAEFMPLSVNLAFLPDVTKLAVAHYNNRPDFARTTSSVGTVTMSATGMTIATGSQSTDVTAGADTLFTQGKANRTRLVGFPDFMSVKIDKGSLGAIIPIQGMFTPLGLSFEDVAEASISIPVAESYGVPVAAAWDAIASSASRSQLCTAAIIGGQIANSTSPARPGQMHLVTEVYYTRAIDVNIQSKNAMALGVARDRQNATAATLPSVSPTGVVTNPAVVGNPQTSTTLQQMGSVAGGIVQILSARNAVPGVSLAYEHGSSSTINMRRIFDRPVAIGYRSVALDVKPTADGKSCAINVIAALSPTPASDNIKIPLTPPGGPVK